MSFHPDQHYETGKHDPRIFRKERPQVTFLERQGNGPPSRPKNVDPTDTSRRLKAGFPQELAQTVHVSKQNTDKNDPFLLTFWYYCK